MPDKTLDAAVPDGYRGLLATSLTVGGVLLVVFASGLGTIMVQHNSGGSVSWSPDEASAMALNLRCLGFLAFLGGCTERVILAVMAAASLNEARQSGQSAGAAGGSLLESNLPQ